MRHTLKFVVAALLATTLQFPVLSKGSSCETVPSVTELLTKEAAKEQAQHDQQVNDVIYLTNKTLKYSFQASNPNKEINVGAWWSATKEVPQYFRDSITILSKSGWSARVQVSKMHDVYISDDGRIEYTLTLYVRPASPVTPVLPTCSCLQHAVR